MARLRVEAGKSQGKSVEFDRQAIVGRGETTQLQINDLKASREHFKVFEQAGSWQVADLNSTNGIKVNGVSTTRKTLSHGDKIEVGETVMVFEMTAPAGKPVSAAAAETGDMPAVKGAPARTAPPPAPSRSPAPAAAAKAGSSAAAKKAAAMADARAAAAKSARPAAAAATAKPKGGAGRSSPTGEGVEVSDRVLQFHKVDTRKATVMDVDLTQSPGTTKFLIFLGCAAFLGLLAWLFSTLVQ